ncbi:TPR repeat-containing protein [Chloroherpeton thalassium ATCC 35110]|uniref:TPR repeat-containing protein n=1 Tax=Chloroherpeton thalassium (strain ATCC 35110 / GB-78) TaxID=517418 RepID=B3QTL9_CHLT3|nr:tetratricopeptide repeat protein [Chloroherpeton thalassium]ACF12765.1 TPR repeat-containing protein [Chloroherpeton thalassium ATCC 35110]
MMRGIYLAAVFALVILFCGGCARDDDSLFGKAYHNFSAYFNAYYNASIEFEKGISAMREAQTFSASDNLHIFSKTENNTAGKANFEKVITKTSEILKSHPVSDLADNALLLMGKAYFYTNELQPAERKFKEILTNYPDSDIFDEASFWYGRTLTRQFHTEEAAEILRSIMKSSKTSDVVMAKCYFSLAELAINEGNLEEAAMLIESGLALEDSEDLKTLAAYTLARIYDQLHRFKKAAETYTFLLNLSPSYEMHYIAQLNTGIALREQSRARLAIKIFQDLLADDNNLENFGEIRFELATAYAQNDELGKAFDLYQEIIYRHPGTEAAAKSFYQLGKLRMEISQDLTMAKTLFDSAKAAYPKGDIAKKAQEQSTTLKNLLDLYDETIQLDSTIQLGILATADVLAEDTALPNDSLESEPAPKKEEPPRKRTRQDYRKSAFLARGAHDAFNETTTQKSSTSTKPKFQPAANEAALKQYQIQAIENRIALGRFYHLTMQTPDSALSWYTQALRKIQADSSDKLATLREVVLFSLSDIYRNLGDTTQMDSVYKVLLADFPESAYINRVREHFNLPKLRRGENAPEQILYTNAIQTLENSQADTSLAMLKTLLSRYPNSALIPKVLLGIGFIYENNLSEPDSAILAYQKLAADYPKSEEAKHVKNKLDAVQSRAKLIPTTPDDKIELPEKPPTPAPEMNRLERFPIKKDSTKANGVQPELQKMIKFAGNRADSVQHNPEKQNLE